MSNCYLDTSSQFYSQPRTQGFIFAHRHARRYEKSAVGSGDKTLGTRLFESFLKALSCVITSSDKSSALCTFSWTVITGFFVSLITCKFLKVKIKTHAASLRVLYDQWLALIRFGSSLSELLARSRRMESLTASHYNSAMWTQLVNSNLQYVCK